METVPIVLPDDEPTLTGTGLILRPFSRDDVPAMVEACQDLQIQRYTSVPVPYTEDDAFAMVCRYVPIGYEQEVAANFVVADPADGRLLGTAGLVRMNLPKRVAEVGYWIAPWARGRGLAVAATTMLVEWALELGFDRVELLAEPENEGSLAVAAKAGFIVEGTLREYSVIRGARRDLVMHSILRSDRE